MSPTRFNRRRFLKNSSLGAGAALLSVRVGRAAGFTSSNDRPRIGVVGCGSRWGWQLANGGRYGVGPQFAQHADYVAACDVDQRRVQAAQGLIKDWNGQKPDAYADYRDLLQRDDIDAVVIFTPDHWHAKVAIEAMLAGKDVYCEKPLTLTIEEGQQIGEVCRKTGRIFQVGTQQRSNRNFLTAIAMIRDGRLGKIKRVECGVGGAPTSPEIPVAEPPDALDWNRWLGPAPWTEYRVLEGASNETGRWSRCHYEFRWWYEYSGGKLTDWGAHHVDIATWALGKTETGPVEVVPETIEHPVPFEDGYPAVKDRYNTATKFKFAIRYGDGIELSLRHNARNGLLFEGTEGRIFVSRGSLHGAPAEALADNPLPDGALDAVYKNGLAPQPGGGGGSRAHVRNFFESVDERREPVSDVFSHHRGLTTCHLAGIAGRLERAVKWDPEKEAVVGDRQAESLIARKKRDGFEIEMG